jgi:hypothetical protein
VTQTRTPPRLPDPQEFGLRTDHIYEPDDPRLAAYNDALRLYSRRCADEAKRDFMPTIDDQIQEARLREARAQADLAELRLQQERMQATPARTDPPASSQPATCSICSQGIRFDGTALFVGRVYNWSVYICGECTPKVREALRTAKP